MMFLSFVVALSIYFLVGCLFTVGVNRLTSVNINTEEGEHFLFAVLWPFILLVLVGRWVDKTLVKLGGQ
jgi:membrane protein insertase Oxa1/YidC/SpoIIIJ